ncbi:MAG: HD domain-containing protein, partial [Lachnospiraceae bacterium]|nr:HD domain-containing protein [Lachnospiraceae bacterium]
MDEIRLRQQLEFILELDKIKSIMRQTYLANGTRKENDAEHSWH